MNKKVIAFLTTIVLSLTLFATTSFAATHTVTKGETLYSISKKYNTTVANIKSLNKLKSNNIKVSQRLTVPSGKVTQAKKTTAKAVSRSTSSSVAKTIRVTSTAYTAYCRGCSGITATGINLKKNPNAKVIAVDPRVIPLGSRVWVEGYGNAIAGDKGGAIKGNKIDVFVNSTSQAYKWGRRTVTVKILN